LQYSEGPNEVTATESQFIQLSLWEISETVQDPCPKDVKLSNLSFSLPIQERPQYRLLNEGAKALSLAELLAILLSRNKSDARASLRLAYQVLSELENGEADSSRRLKNMSAQELARLTGINTHRALLIVAAIELGKRLFFPPILTGTIIDTPEAAANALAPDLMWEVDERFAVLLLDVKHKLLAKKILSIGTRTNTIASPSDAFGEALRQGATRIIVAHNHPSGDLAPSDEDILLTQELLSVGRSLNLPVLDHLILGNGSFVSLRQTTDLWRELS